MVPFIEISGSLLYSYFSTCILYCTLEEGFIGIWHVPYLGSTIVYVRNILSTTAVMYSKGYLISCVTFVLNHKTKTTGAECHIYNT